MQDSLRLSVIYNYLRDPGLCGPPLNNSCNPLAANVLPFPASTITKEDGDVGWLALQDFLWSFGMMAYIAFMARHQSTGARGILTMRRGWRKYVLWMLLASLIWACNGEGCIEEERVALLNLNSYMKSHVDPKCTEYFGGLDYGEEDKYNCCSWRRVRCNPTTQCVAELDLKSMHVVIVGGEKPWIFNVTVVQPFWELTSLDLSYNVFGSLAEKDGSTRLSTLKNLQSLVLNGYNETGQIFLSDLAVLKNLPLTSWNLKESTLQGIENLRELQNHLSGSLPSCLQNLSSLLVLDLSYNRINRWFQDIPFNLVSLGDLYMSNNNLKVTVVTQYFPKSCFLGAPLKLQFLDLSRSQLRVEIEGLSWYPSFQLQYLGLQACNLNWSEGTMAKFLSRQNNLSYIDLSDNNLADSFASWLLGNETLLTDLDRENDSATLPLYFRHSLDTLIISGNNFHSELPGNVGFLFPQLTSLNVSRCHLEGSIPASLAHMSQLHVLDLSFNNLSGALPRGLLSNTSLGLLQLNDNNLRGEIIPEDMNLPLLSNMQGQIPTEVCKLQYLRYLDLFENSFTGSIPSCSNFYSLISFMFLQHNSFTGAMPSALSSGSQLMAVLKLGANNFHGHIPNELCHLQDVAILDLSHNQLSGRLPIIISANYIANMDIEGNVPNVAEDMELLVKNQYLSYTGGILELMSALDLSSNKLSGLIPLELGDLQHLHSLNLSHNGLIGSIPSSLSNLKAVESLDLSFNNLSGMIPIQLADLTFLAVFNVSYNNLIERAPKTGQFGNFDERSYLGNPGLCLSILYKSCNPVPTSALPSPTSTTLEEDGDEGGFYMEDFLWSFRMTSFIACVETIVVLAIQWRESWSNLVEWHLLWWLL
ncbi:hypothetical protein Cgig2_012413 [Carnegiea gigantea]|uniref:Uncharacterized protein n=1 Tax=Carnegiea gigantea TaxID=171969 RepID=A0A9Q1KM83_9CARY|nr:hypothetical protein Cgig2_012413 [Carnegiea gigantea]